MERIIKISNKEYKMKSSAYTLFSYKNEFKADFLKDLKKVVESMQGIDLKKLENLENNNELSSVLPIFDGVSDMINIIYQISYIMIKEADKNQVASFADFLKSVDSLLDDESDWLTEVIELATLPFVGRTKAN